MNRWVLAGRRIAVALALAEALVNLACVGSDAPPSDTVTPEAGGGNEAAAPGTEGEACFPNDTCLGTLACRSGRCVDLGPGASDASQLLDATDAGKTPSMNNDAAMDAGGGGGG